MVTPYDWQEGIGNRAQYIEAKLSQGAPVLAVSLDVGILVFTYRRQARKIYEIYDRLLFAGVGQQSDVEAMRAAALEFASREGYNRSEEDVTIQRVATAMSDPIKKAFSDFMSAPLVARSLFAEINETPATDLYYTLDYDGNYSMSRQSAVVAGSDERADAIREKLATVSAELSPEAAVDVLRDAWDAGADEDAPLEGLKPEAVLLERSTSRENRFRSMFPEDF